MTVTAWISDWSGRPAAPPSSHLSAPDGRSAPECLSSIGDQNALARCLWPLLEALGWEGEARHVVEALPHFANNLDLKAFRDVLARLGYVSILLPDQRCDRIDARLLPALLLTDDGRRLVICAPDADGRTLVRNPARDTEGADDLRRLRGQVCLFRRAEGPDAEREAAETGRWTGFLIDRFRAEHLRVLGLTFVGALLGMAPALFVLALLDQVIATQSGQLLIALLAGLACAALCEILVRAMRGLSLSTLGPRIERRVAHGIFRQLLYQPLQQHREMGAGLKLQRLRQSGQVRESLSGPPLMALMELPFTVIPCLVLVSVAGGLALVPTAAVAACALVAWALAPGMGRAALQAKTHALAKQGFLSEAIPLCSDVRLSGAAPVWCGRFRELSGRAAHAEFRVAAWSALLVAIGRIAILVALLAVTGLGALRVIDGDLSTGALAATVALTWLALRPWQRGLPALTGLAMLRSEVRELDQIIRGGIEDDALSRGKDVPPVRSGRIRIAGLRLNHAPETEAATGMIDVDIPRGEIVAITGPNGAGKSSLLHLILGLHQPQAGAILIDEVEIGQHAPIALRQMIGHVPADFRLFYGTIRQNLLLSSPTASQSEIEEATRRAGVHAAIAGLPDGYEHRVGDARGTLVSDTIRNGIALASAYLRGRHILLLDEAVDGLDDQMTATFRAELDRLRGQTTTLIVTHRPSTMRCADRLLVMDGGRIVESGRPQDLLK